MSKAVLTYGFIKSITPIKQATAVLLVTSVAIIIASFISANQEIEWFLMVTALGFYTWMNAILSFFCQELWIKYFLKSIGLFIILTFLLGLLAKSLSTTYIFNIREYQIMYVATCIFYICALLVVNIIRQVASLMGIEV